ncbi:hypothetical protein BT67DRAFT_443542 [Trichocladium antarcticum]|uniref:Uncharacterized protein n=1 Tax=Trichocladium antarcticum TaxID=1450529 RepID=A0AAN6UGL2_9PEZI|nr:hypothetical protein BT67DRAFT_443542 [Trichocladium antarcticum]
MCTYDYTPYTGCHDGQQHFYIQWMKCDRARDNNKYCSLQKSTEAEVLRKLSTNVLSCPLHGPIAVQQQIFDALQQKTPDGIASRYQREQTEEPRARNTTRRGRTSEKRSEPPARKEVRKRRPVRDVHPGSSDSESSSDSPVRPRTADGPKRPPASELAERRKTSMVRGNLHRRASSAELLPAARVLPMRLGRSEVSLPLKSEPEAQVDDVPKQTGPRSILKSPMCRGIIGLPSSPDMLHRAKSEGLLRQVKDDQGEPVEPTARNTISPSSDSSPDHSSEQVPFGNGTSRRGRRAGARSIRDRSVDTVMRRIDEHVIAEGIDGPEVGARQSTSPPRASISTPRSSTTTSPEPQNREFSMAQCIVATTSSGAPIYGNDDPRPRLHTLRIPQQGDPHFRGASPASAATPLQQDSPQQSLRVRNSFRHASSPASALNITISPQRNDETSSIRSTKSRRFEDHVADGRKWATAARAPMPINGAAVAAAAAATASRSPPTDVLLAHMSESSLPLAAPGTALSAARESIDSGYRSGPGHQHHRQRSRDVGAAAAEKGTGTGTGTGAGCGGGGRLLQKTPPHPRQLPGQDGMQGPGAAPAPASDSWPLGVQGLPPCALPVSLMSPGLQSEFDVSVGKPGKVSLLQRIGLRKKFGGRLWDRGGQRDVGVEG